MKMTCV